MGIRYLIITLLNIALGIVSFFLGLRIILRLFGANVSTPIVSWIYNISESLIAPFNGIFPSTTLVPGSVFDIPALIALLAYGVIFYAVIAILNTIFNSMTIGSGRVTTDEHVHTTHV